MLVQDVRTLLAMIRQVFYIMTREQRRKSVLVFIVIIIGAGFETIGVSAMLPFIESLLNPIQLKEKWFIQPLVNIFHIRSNLSIILLMGILIIFIYIIKNIYLIFSIFLQTKFKNDFQGDISTKMLRHYLKRPYSDFLKINSAEVLRGIDGDVTAVFVSFEYLMKSLTETVLIVMLCVFLLMTDFIMASGMLLLVGLCFIVVMKGNKKILRGIGEKRRREQMLAHKYAYQVVNGIKEVNVMNRKNFFVRQYEVSYKNAMDADRIYSFFSACPEKIIETVCVCGLIVIVCCRIAMGVDAAKFVPQLAAYALAAFRILPSIAKLLGYINGLIYQRVGVENAYRNIKEVEEYECQRREKIQEDKTENDIFSSLKFQTCLTLNDITWRYENSEKVVLNHLNLRIKKGESIAFIGASGAGKTTLSDIILGLFQPQEGKILMDDIDIFTIPLQWSRIIGYVPQTIFLIDDTIRNNIAFGIETDEIDDRLIWKTLKQAQLEEFVKQLPDGLDTLVGERGVRFSGGQRQRVAIARALYYNPDILVLDEATSALDNETEKAVMESIDMLQGNKTLIIVAHRLTTVQKCDIIYEIKDGKAFMVDKKKLGAK